MAEHSVSMHTLGPMAMYYILSCMEARKLEGKGCPAERILLLLKAASALTLGAPCFHATILSAISVNAQHLAYTHPFFVLQPGDDSEGSESDAFLTSAMEEVESGKAEEGVPFSSEKFESALTDAFNRTDEEFGKADNAALVGTTAVVALVGSRQLYVANCGE